MKVVAGTLKLSDPKVTREVQKKIVHKRYDPLNSWKNDIALLKVRTVQKINFIY